MVPFRGAQTCDFRILYRGLGYLPPDYFGASETDKGYVSTSVSFKVARYFAIEINDNAVTSSRKAVFAIYLNRSGEKGILIDQKEDEVILKHCMNFKIMAKKDNARKYDLYLVQACSENCATSVRSDVADFWANFNMQD